MPEQGPDWLLARERAYAAVYAYLADHPHDPPTRDHMIGLVWGAVMAALDAYDKKFLDDE